jgi:hypothetical protein
VPFVFFVAAFRLVRHRSPFKVGGH